MREHTATARLECQLPATQLPTTQLPIPLHPGTTQEASPSPLTDRDRLDTDCRALMARVTRQDEAGLAALYDLTCSTVFGLTKSILRDDRDAEESTLEVYQQVWAQADRYDPTRGTPLGWLIMILAGATPWKQSGFPGITIRALYVDRARGRETMLVRMEAGASYLPHHHEGVEESFVLEGDIACDGETLTAGDYHRAEAGTYHGVPDHQHRVHALDHLRVIARGSPGRRATAVVRIRYALARAAHTKSVCCRGSGAAPRQPVEAQQGERASGPGRNVSFSPEQSPRAQRDAATTHTTGRSRGRR